jgi:hypothetical protein
MTIAAVCEGHGGSRDVISRLERGFELKRASLWLVVLKRWSLTGVVTLCKYGDAGDIVVAVL